MVGFWHCSKFASKSLPATPEAKNPDCFQRLISEPERQASYLPSASSASPYDWDGPVVPFHPFLAEVVPFHPFLAEGSPTKIDYRKELDLHNCACREQREAAFSQLH